MDQKLLEEMKDKPLVMCEAMSNLYVNVPSTVSLIKSEAPPVHVGASPKEQTAAAYKGAFMAMVKERVMNDLQSWNAIADKMKDDDIFEDAHLTWDEIVTFLKTMEGQVVPPSSN